MKIYCNTIMLLALVWILPGTGLLMCENQEEVPYEDRDPRDYRDGSDGIRRYAWLQAHGEYSKLKLIVRSRKTDYNPGERVWLKFFVRNDSDSEVHVRCAPSYCTRLWKLFHSNYDEAVKTPKLEAIIQQYKEYGTEGQLMGSVRSKYECIKLPPGQEAELEWRCLNDLFNLSKPDTYELTCFTTSICHFQEYEPPLQSNTLTFRILEGSIHIPTTEEQKKEPNLIYTNPPPGEEVFKQPQPPKNVFWVHTDTRPYIEYIDVSPYTYIKAYHRQKAKEAEAARAEAEKHAGVQATEEAERPDE